MPHEIIKSVFVCSEVKLSRPSTSDDGLPLILSDFQDKDDDNSQDSESSDAEKADENSTEDLRSAESGGEQPQDASESKQSPDFDASGSHIVIEPEMPGPSRDPQPPDPAVQLSPQNSNVLGVRGLGAARFPSLVRKHSSITLSKFCLKCLYVVLFV